MLPAELSSAGLRVGLNDPRGLFQPKCSYEFMFLQVMSEHLHYITASLLKTYFPCKKVQKLQRKTEKI